MEDRRETVSLSVPATPADASKTVRVERDVVQLEGVTVRVVEVAWLRHSFEVRVDLEGERERRDALTMRWTERNWQWGAVDDLGNRYSERGGQGSSGRYAVRLEPALAPRVHTLAVRVVEAGMVLGDVLLPVGEDAA